MGTSIQSMGHERDSDVGALSHRDGVSTGRDKRGLAFSFVVPLSENRQQGDNLDVPWDTVG